MKVNKEDVQSTEALTDRFALLFIKPQVFECSTPGCDELHAGRVLLVDGLLNAVVPFGTREEAVEHVASLPLGYLAPEEE